MRHESTARLFLLYFFAPVALFLAALLGLSLYLEPLEGDLTRLGHRAERDFGWRLQQPQLAIRANGGAQEAPNILVLGDSFSRGNLWQSYLAELKRTQVLSYYFRDVGCISNWVEWAAAKPYATAHTVVIETVEREFVSRFARLDACPASEPQAFHIEPAVTAVQRAQIGFNGDIRFLWQTAGNSWSLEAGANHVKAGKVVDTGLTTPRFFSSRLASRLLYLASDEEKREWDEARIATAAANLRQIQDKLKRCGLQVLVVVIPDKSSVYGPYFSDPNERSGYLNIYPALAKAGVDTIDWLEYFQGQMMDTVDLYKPNDTHLSVRGYELLAERLARQM